MAPAMRLLTEKSFVYKTGHINVQKCRQDKRVPFQVFFSHQVATVDTKTDGATFLFLAAKLKLMRLTFTFFFTEEPHPSNLRCVNKAKLGRSLRDGGWGSR